MDLLSSTTSQPLTATSSAMPLATSGQPQQQQLRLTSCKLLELRILYGFTFNRMSRLLTRLLVKHGILLLPKCLLSERKLGSKYARQHGILLRCHVRRFCRWARVFLAELSQGLSKAHFTHQKEKRNLLVRDRRVGYIEDFCPILGS